jgi:RNA polymerase sigma-70 factor (ECF subfamily)
VDPQLQFEQMYRAHADAVETYARRRSDAQTADEVVADVFLVAWRRLGEVPDDPLPWLLEVARRMLANRRRTHARESALQRRIESMPQDPIVATPSNDDVDAAVIGALERLSEPDREALLLIAWEGLTPAQAAAVIGVRPNTFSTRLSRARRRFERALAAEQNTARQEPNVRTTEHAR